MYVPFDSLPDNARIWIYQSDRKLDDSDVAFLEKSLEEFITSWTAHKQELQASFAVLHHFFIVLAVNESSTEASGCSIDASARHIKHCGEALSVDFFNRQNIAFFKENNVTIRGLAELNALTNNNEIDLQSIFFNNLACSKGDLKKNWKVPVEKTWLANYI